MGRTVVVPYSEGGDVPLVAGADLAGRIGAELRPVAASHHGGLADTLRVVAESDDPIVCVAAGTGGRIGRRRLGPLAAPLLRRLDVPLVLVGPRCDGRRWATGTRLFTCLDGSVLSEAALPVAAGLAEALGLRHCLLHVVPPAPPAPSGDVLECNYVAGVATALRRGGRRATFEVLHGGRPATAIVAHAASRAAALVAVGTHGGAASSGVMGRVGREVVRLSPVPVVAGRSRPLWQAVMGLAEEGPHRTPTGPP